MFVLASGKAEIVTGSEYVIDGGLTKEGRGEIVPVFLAPP